MAKQKTDRITLTQAGVLLASRWKIKPTRMTIHNWIVSGRRGLQLVAEHNAAGDWTTTVADVENFVKELGSANLRCAKAGRPAGTTKLAPAAAPLAEVVASA